MRDALGVEVEIFSIDDVRASVPCRSWVHGWKQSPAENPLRDLFLGGCEGRLVWPALTVTSKRGGTR